MAWAGAHRQSSHRRSSSRRRVCVPLVRGFSLALRLCSKGRCVSPQTSRCRMPQRRWAMPIMFVLLRRSERHGRTTVNGCRTLVLFLSLCGIAQVVSAAPIQAYGGWLDGTLRTYDTFVGSSGFQELIIRHEYVLGVDFYPGVPLSFTQSGTDYVGCAGSNECLSQALPWTTAWAPTQFPIPSGTIGDPASQTPLTDGCSQLLNDFSDRPVLMVARGTCTFLQKWQSAEHGGWGGV